MSDVLLYVDEDAGEDAVVRGLRARGIDVVTTAEVHQLGATDAEQLATAINLRRTIYTFNVGDFAQLHSEFLEQGLEHTGIIVIPDQRHSTGEKVRRVAEFVKRVTADAMLNRMEYL
ncbi:MAG: DUF5615 family PIN-like protein [Candidatus Saccharimonas sp.]|nr:DUF5615 family PIN-like protein [Planctomycetaceae bacterium]